MLGCWQGNFTQVFPRTTLNGGVGVDYVVNVHSFALLLLIRIPILNQFEKDPF
jgi:hypothetical protein